VGRKGRLLDGLLLSTKGGKAKRRGEQALSFLKERKKGEGKWHLIEDYYFACKREKGGAPAAFLKEGGEKRKKGGDGDRLFRKGREEGRGKEGEKKRGRRTFLFRGRVHGGLFFSYSTKHTGGTRGDILIDPFLPSFPSMEERGRREGEKRKHHSDYPLLPSFKRKRGEGRGEEEEKFFPSRLILKEMEEEERGRNFDEGHFTSILLQRGGKGAQKLSAFIHRGGGKVKVGGRKEKREGRPADRHRS